MEAILSKEPLNATQLYLLRTFAHTRSDEVLEELNSVLVDFYQKRLDEELDKWWEEKEMTVEKFEEICSDIHYRTPYSAK
jgi:hypothetical protein